MCNPSSVLPASAQAIMKFLDCPCVYFPSMEDDDPIMDAFESAKSEGREHGFVPVLIAADETLWEGLMANTKAGENGYVFSLNKVKNYRNSLLSAPVENGLEILSQYISENEYDNQNIDELVTDTEGINRFYGYWDYSTEKTYPLILAKIPVVNPWEVFAYIPFGGQNQAPDVKEIMAVSKYWFEQHGAIPAVITQDVLEFSLEKPVKQSDAVKLATQQLAICPDIIEQNSENMNTADFAAALSLSKVWYFCW